MAPVFDVVSTNVHTPREDTGSTLDVWNEKGMRTLAILQPKKV